MEEELKAEMREVQHESHVVFEEEVKLKVSMTQSIKCVNDGLGGLRDSLRDAEQEILEMQTLISSQQSVIEAQHQSLEMCNERADAAARAEEAMRSEISELFAEMRELRPRVSEQHE